jgi:hypothetical protein
MKNIDIIIYLCLFELGILLIIYDLIFKQYLSIPFCWWVIGK